MAKDKSVVIISSEEEYPESTHLHAQFLKGVKHLLLFQAKLKSKKIAHLIWQKINLQWSYHQMRDIQNPRICIIISSLSGKHLMMILCVVCIFHTPISYTHFIHLFSTPISHTLFIHPFHTPSDDDHQMFPKVTWYADDVGILVIPLRWYDHCGLSLPVT